MAKFRDKVVRGVTLDSLLWTRIKIACARYELEHPGESMSAQRYIVNAIMDKIHNEPTDPICVPPLGEDRED